MYERAVHTITKYYIVLIEIAFHTKTVLHTDRFESALESKHECTFPSVHVHVLNIRLFSDASLSGAIVH